METVIVTDTAHPNGEYVINKKDFDSSIHTIKGEEKVKAKKSKNEEG